MEVKMSLKFLGYLVFYLILTAFFVYIFVKEKKLAQKAELRRERWLEKIVEKFLIVDEKKIKILRKTMNYIETIVVAGVLVVVIQRFYIGNFKIPTGSMIPTIEVGDRVFGNMIKYKFMKPERNEIIVFEEPIQNKVLYTKRAMGLPGETVKFENQKLYINGKAIEERNYSNLGIENQEWVVPKKGDKLKIIPAGNYTEAYKAYSLDIAKIQEELKTNSMAIEAYLPNLKFILNGKETGKILDFIHDKKVLSELINGNEVEVILDKDYYLALGDNTDNSFDSRMWGFVAENRIRGKAVFRFWPLNRIGIVK
ncbi:signal peptidase I [Fusobacterium massiliense]|uniref:signal peptidase I n=1 Tax=Fusobacterium massiliense TaxID=1852365 RepID=UPI0036F4427F